MKQSPYSNNRLIHARLVILGFIATLFFGYPLITLPHSYFFKLPTLFIYIFGLWLILIFLAYLLQRRNRISNQNINPKSAISSN